MNIANIYKIMIDTYIIYVFLSSNRVFFMFLTIIRQMP